MMLHINKRWFGKLPIFDPDKGKTVLKPPGQGPGYWAGGGSVIYDEELSKFYLYYRLRRPKQLNDPEERGFECRIAESGEGENFQDIWSAKKQEFNSFSMERGALVKTLEGRYRLYISYDDCTDHRWKIDVMEADTPSSFDVSKRRRLIEPSQFGLYDVKDPCVVYLNKKYYMLLCYTIDGLVERTGLAISEDNGDNFKWIGEILSPGIGWDADCARITSLVYTPPVFLAFYDGRPNHDEDFEEKPALAISFDLHKFEKVSSGPLFLSPHASHCIRYIEALDVGEDRYFYYEYTCPDGSHEYRVNKIRR